MNSRTIPLKRIAQINQRVLGDDTPPDNIMRYVDISNVDETGRILETQELTFDKAPSRARRLVQSGDTIISTVRTYLKAIAFLPNPEPELVVSTGFAVLSPRKEIEPRYLSWAVRSEGFVGDVVARSVGVSYPAITATELGDVPVSVHPLAAQCRIADFLDRETAKIDALIDEKKRLLKLLDERRQALITEAVTRGLDPNVPMRPSGLSWLGEIPAHWKVAPLKFSTTVGNGSTPSRDNPEYWDQGHFPWLNSSVVNQDEVTSADQFVTDVALRECHLPIVQPPAVLVGITGQGRTRGTATILRVTATINQHIAFLKPNDSLYSVEYLRAILSTVYSFLREESDGAGSTKGAITCEQLGNLRVPRPPFDEQTAIFAEIESQLYRSNNVVEAIYGHLDRLKNPVGVVPKSKSTLPNSMRVGVNHPYSLRVDG